MARPDSLSDHIRHLLDEEATWLSEAPDHADQWIKDLRASNREARVAAAKMVRQEIADAIELLRTLGLITR